MKQDFSISGGSVGNQEQGAPHVYVKITNNLGEVGWGEARPSHRWSYETEESVIATINNYIEPILVGENPVDLQSISKKMNKQIASGLAMGQPIAKAAVDMALHDLIGKHTNRNLVDLWFGTFKEEIQLSYLINTGDPEEAFKKGEYAKKYGYSGLDVKIGLDPNNDVTVLEAIKEAAPELYLRVDANQ